MYEISKSDFEKLEKDMHVEISRLLRRYVMVRADAIVEPNADQAAPVPEKKKRGRKQKSDDEKRVDREIKENIRVEGQEKKKRGRPKKNS